MISSAGVISVVGFSLIFFFRFFDFFGNSAPTLEPPTPTSAPTYTRVVQEEALVPLSYSPSCRRSLLVVLLPLAGTNKEPPEGLPPVPAATVTVTLHLHGTTAVSQTSVKFLVRFVRSFSPSLSHPFSHAFPLTLVQSTVVPSLEFFSRKSPFGLVEASPRTMPHTAVALQW